MTPLPSMESTGDRLTIRQDVQYQQTHLYEDYTRNLGGFLIVLVFLSFGSMSLRVACRLRIKEPLGRDDWTYIVGTTLSIGSFIVMLIYAFDAGLGKHWIALTPDQQILFPKLNFAYNILNVSCYPLVKISILLLYLRVFGVLPTFRRVVWGGVAVVGAAGLANTLVAILSCQPIRGFFDTSVPAKCIDSVSFYYWTSAFNCATDLFILVAPMPVIWRRNINHRWAVTTLFVLGSLTFVISILRVVYYLNYSMSDPSYSFLDSGYATPGEVCLATVVAAAPAWGPMWRASGRGLRSLYSSVGRRSRGQQSIASDSVPSDKMATVANHNNPEKDAGAVYVHEQASSAETSLDSKGRI